MPDSTVAAPSTSTTQLSAQHIPALDGIRGIAVIMVALGHLVYVINPNWWIPQTLDHYGRFGVDVFFVLSGFLITGILLDTLKSPVYFKRFYIRRAFRILPLYYAALAFIAMLDGFGLLQHRMPLPGDWKYYLLYIVNWRPLASIKIPQITGHFWSLAIEEQFYLVWPFVVFLIPKPSLRSVAKIGIFSSLLLRLCLVFLLSNGWPAYYNTFFRLDGLLMGALGAILVRDPERLKRTHPERWLFWGALGIMSLFPFRGFDGSNSYGMSAVAVCSLALIVRAYQGHEDSFLSLPALRGIGRVSYGFYVLHIPLFMIVGAWIGPVSNPLGALMSSMCVMIAAYGLAKLSHRYFETPLMRLRERF